MLDPAWFGLTASSLSTLRHAVVGPSRFALSRSCLAVNAAVHSMLMAVLLVVRACSAFASMGHVRYVPLCRSLCTLEARRLLTGCVFVVFLRCAGRHLISCSVLGLRGAVADGLRSPSMRVVFIISVVCFCGCLLLT